MFAAAGWCSTLIAVQVTGVAIHPGFPVAAGSSVWAAKSLPNMYGCSRSSASSSQSPPSTSWSRAGGMERADGSPGGAGVPVRTPGAGFCERVIARSS